LAPGIYETKFLSRETGVTSTRASRQRPAAFRMGINGQQRTIRHPFHRMMCSHPYFGRQTGDPFARELAAVAWRRGSYVTKRIQEQKNR
jgi:hypothetical protein